jgi:hypothetical protein
MGHLSQRNGYKGSPHWEYCASCPDNIVGYNFTYTCVYIKDINMA